MKKMLLLLVLSPVIVFAEYAIFCNFSSAETATEVIESVWEDAYPPKVETEVIFAKEIGGEGRDVGMWIDYASNSAEIFIGNYDKSRKRFDRRSGGTLYVSENNSFGYRVYVSRETGRRANIKERANETLESPANGTWLNYFDIVRTVLPESVDNFEFSFVGNSKEAWQIKIKPKKQIYGDYNHRIFEIKKMNDGQKVISAVRYFRLGEEKNKANIDFEKCEINNVSFWRPSRILVSTEKGQTELVVTGRFFNVDFGKFSEEDLKKGSPVKW